jgi:hypothetical protein
MSQIKGASEFKKFKEGGQLTRKQAIWANCYECNCGEPGCLSTHCPLYRWSPYTKVSCLVGLEAKNPRLRHKEKASPKSKSTNPVKESPKLIERG